MAKKSEDYVVGILFNYDDRTEIKFVTEVNVANKSAYWNSGKEAMVFSKEYAKDLAFGLCVNGYVAIPMFKANYLNLGNSETEKSEEKFLEIYREDYKPSQFSEMLASLGLNDDEVGEAFMIKGVVVKDTLKVMEEK